jgi:acetyl-CoA synthetase
VPDALRGLVAKAFLVKSAEVAETEIVEFMKRQLSQHEYPRQIEFVDELPKTPAGKINRKALRERAGRDTPQGAKL